MKKMPVFFMIFVLAVAAVAIFGLHQIKASPKLIPREILFGSPKQAAPQISPDGASVAYLAPDQGVLNVWIRDRRTKTDRVLTRDRGRGIRYYAWLPDGNSILFVQDQGGNENWHLYRIPFAGGEAQDLTPFEGVQARVLDIDKHFPETILIEMNKEDRSRHDVYRLNLKTGALELVTRNMGQVSEWITDADMKVRGASRTRPEGGSDLLIRKDEKSEWEKVLTWDFEDNMTSAALGFTGDGKELYLHDSRGRDTSALLKWDPVTRAGKILLEDPKFDVGSVVLNPDDHEIDMVMIYREKAEWVPFRDNIREDLEVLGKLCKGEFSIVSRTREDRYWIVRYEDDASPVKYYIYDRIEKRSEFLFVHQPELSKYTLYPIEPVKILSRDGIEMTGYKTLPRSGKGPFPMVLLVHGGPWARDTWGYEPTAQWLADRGYVCLQVNFRGSVGFGKAFVNAGNKEWGRKMQDDLTDSVAWAVQQGIADPKRIGIMGASYGGYAALAAAAFTPDVFKCGVDLFGPSNLITLIQSMPPYWSVERANILRRLGDPATEEALLKERSPLFHADRMRIPFLIAQGVNDPRTTKPESDRIVEALRKRGIECDYMVFPDEGHGFAKPENRLKFFKAAEAFLAKHLGGRHEK